MLRDIWLALGWLWIAVVCYLSLMPHPPQPINFDGIDKLEHVLAYISLMLWFCQAYVEKLSRIWLMLSLMAMGAGIEILQGMSGFRYFEWSDLLANITGVLIGWRLARTFMGRVLMKLEKYGAH
ncbi:MAG: VanZ family protein [Sideroxydans sp.]|jgi:VanZ family protein